MARTISLILRSARESASRRTITASSETTPLLHAQRGVRGYPLALQRAQPETLHLAGLGTRQRGDELYPARIFVGRDLRLDEILQRLHQRRVGARRIARHDERLDDLAARGVGRADDGAFADFGMIEQHRLDLRAGDVVAGADDHVVAARLVPEIA